MSQDLRESILLKISILVWGKYILKWQQIRKKQQKANLFADSHFCIFTPSNIIFGDFFDKLRKIMVVSMFLSKL